MVRGPTKSPRALTRLMHVMLVRETATTGHASWVVTLNSLEEHEFSGRTLEEAFAWCLVWLMTTESGHRPLYACKPAAPRRQCARNINAALLPWSCSCRMVLGSALVVPSLLRGLPLPAPTSCRVCRSALRPATIAIAATSLPR